MALANEVKARAESGAIRLSANEWKKARHFGERFWLYIVAMTGTDPPQLHRAQNPAAHFRMDEDIFATGFIILSRSKFAQPGLLNPDKIGDLAIPSEQKSDLLILEEKWIDRVQRL